MNWSTDSAEDALLIYTNGIDGETKGAVHTHRGIQASMESLVEAWDWESTDRILNTLPLHQVHGIIKIFNCALKR